MNNRIIHIDWLKATAIYLVILGHQPISCVEVHDWIFTFHVPLFFFISGYLMKLEYREDFIWKNIRSLLLVTIPYFALNLVLGIFIDFLFYRDDLNVDHNLTTPMINYLLGKSEAGVVWFLIALFWMRIIYYYSYLHLKNSYVVLLLSMIVSLFVAYTGFSFNYYQITATLIAFPFFCFGVCLRQNRLENKHISLWVWTIFGFVFSAIPVLLLPVVGQINLSALLLGNSIPLYYFVSLAGALGLFCFSKMIKKESSIISVISNGTLVILLLHMPILLYFKAAYKLTMGIKTPPPIYGSFVSNCYIADYYSYPIFTYKMVANS